MITDKRVWSKISRNEAVPSTPRVASFTIRVLVMRLVLLFVILLQIIQWYNTGFRSRLYWAISCIFTVLQSLHERHRDTLASANVEVDGIDGTTGGGASISFRGGDLDGLVPSLNVGGFENVAGTQRVTVLKGFKRQNVSVLLKAN